MLKIRITSGNYGHKKNGKTITIRLGETVDVADDEARRLVDLKVAEIVKDDIDEEINGKGVATGGNDDNANDPNANPPENENGAEGENEDGNDDAKHLDEEQLNSMTNANLKKLAEDLGIDTSKLKVKADFVTAILKVNVDVDDDEVPPAVGAEGPVE